MKLSIIIVNYNVEYFLEQCLHSVLNATKHISSETFVVDNNSFDGSCDMVKTKFPNVILIENKINIGFSKANNKAIKLSKGEYILLLNPDTIVEENTFEKCIEFMELNSDCGGIGVYMIDGNGNYLPESKRGLPTPWVAFCKISGLGKVFKNSAKFNKYYLGHLDNKETHSIEILSGAYMFLRKEALEKIGLLDEKFFMYGEDIDLSYRIIQGGFKNYYLPTTKIIHYKGESTKKSSVNYVFVFYNAMIIFAKKHFSQKNAKAFTGLIKCAIYARALAAIFSRFLKSFWIPAIDFIVLISGFIGTEILYKYYTGISWPIKITQFLFPIWALEICFFIWVFGGYDRPVKSSKLLKGLGIAGLLFIGSYALLPKNIQLSRTLILSGTIYSFLAMFIVRFILSICNVNGYHLSKKNRKKILIAGDEAECERVERIISNSTARTPEIRRINASKIKTENIVSSTFDDLIHSLKIDEIIFCARNFTAAEIMCFMSSTTSRQVEFKIAQPESMFIIGSNSVNSSDDILVQELNSISQLGNKRAKRVFDIIACLVFIAILPLSTLIQKKPILFLKNLLHVLSGKKSWVGYLKGDENRNLPIIKQGILAGHLVQIRLPETSTIKKLNLIYARDYKVLNDLKICFLNLRNLGGI